MCALPQNPTPEACSRFRSTRLNLMTIVLCFSVRAGGGSQAALKEQEQQTRRDAQVARSTSEEERVRALAQLKHLDAALATAHADLAKVCGVVSMTENRLCLYASTLKYHRALSKHIHLAKRFFIWRGCKCWASGFPYRATVFAPLMICWSTACRLPAMVLCRVKRHPT